MPSVWLAGTIRSSSPWKKMTGHLTRSAKWTGERSSVNPLLGRVFADQPLIVTRLEFVRVEIERFEVADAVVACTPFEEIAEREGGQRRVSARAAPGDHRAAAIDEALLSQMFCTVMQSSTSTTPHAPWSRSRYSRPIARASPIIHVENCDATAGPILNAKIERAAGRRRWSAVTLHEQRRFLPLRRTMSGFCGG